MKYSATLVCGAFLFTGALGTSFAGEESIGAAEYKSNCAACHGISGKGDGPFAEYLKNGAPSLTVLKKNNGGVFPVDKVYQLIDGRGLAKGHGTREMPIWGAQYTAQSVKEHGPFFGEWYAQDVIQARILALISHIYTLQE